MCSFNSKKITPIFITGPTASGKTSLGVFLAHHFNGEIISADSRQIYKELNIGSGKDLSEYKKFSPSIPHHLIDEISWKKEFSVYEFQKRAVKVAKKIISLGKRVFVVGGSNLYLSSLLNNYDFKEKELFNLKNIFKDKLILVPYYHRKVLHQKIKKRLELRWDAMLLEVKALIKKGITFEKLAWLGLEYKFLGEFYFNKSIKEKEVFQNLLIKIRNFARRQDIWLRKLEKQGHDIYYLNEKDKENQAFNLVKNFLLGKKLSRPAISLKNIFYGPKSN